MRRISKTAFCSALATLLLLAGLPINVRADDSGLLTAPSLRDRLNSGAGVTFVNYCRPGNCNPCPCRPNQGNAPMTDEQAAQQPGQQQQPGQEEPRADMQAEQFGGLGSDTLTINDAPGGYIDNPIVGTWFRMRYDDANNNTRPDRAEFFYARCGGPGPTQGINSRVDYREVTPYFELQMAPRLSIFAELPTRFIDITFQDPVAPVSNAGFSDMNAGFKYALYSDRCQYLTFQFKTYIPTGNAALGLGTNHVSLEPGLLYMQRLSERAYFQGELRHWIPVGGTDFAGNVIRYGAGIGLDLFQTYDQDVRQVYTSNQGLRVTSVTEFVGWTVMGGKETISDSAGGLIVQSASGDTIVNLKQGLRLSAGKSSFYVGWGHALTGPTWYQDLFRLEYRRMF